MEIKLTASQTKAVQGIVDDVNVGKEKDNLVTVDSYLLARFQDLLDRYVANSAKKDKDAFMAKLDKASPSQLASIDALLK